MGDLLKTLDPIFADCVCAETSRYAIAQPWVHNGFAYATNGRILVRQPTKRSSRPFRYARVPSAWHLFDDSKPTGKPIPLPNIGPEQNDVMVCENCKGRKRKCSACDGEGSITRKHRSIELAPGLSKGLADYYVWLLQRHGIGEVQLDGASNGKTFCFRKGKKIEGLVMGMTLGTEDDDA